MAKIDGVACRRPSLALTFNTRSYVYLCNRQYDLAVADYTKAVELDADYAPVYLSRGFAYIAQGKKTEDIVDLKRSPFSPMNLSWLKTQKVD